MGWNGSGGGSTPVKPKAAAKKPSPIRGLVAGAVVVALVIGAYFAFFSGSEKTQEEKSDKGRGRIKEVTPTKATISKGAQPATLESVRVHSSELSVPGTNVEAAVVIDPVEAAKTNKNAVVYPKPHFENPTEQLIADIFTTEVGDVPPITPEIPDSHEAELIMVIDKIHKVKKDDSEQVANEKLVVNDVKVELDKFLREGGSVNKFLQYYSEQLMTAHRIFEDSRIAVDEFTKSEGVDAETACAFLEKTNKILEERGITKKIKLGAGQRKRLGMPPEPENEEESK